MFLPAPRLRCIGVFTAATGVAVAAVRLLTPQLGTTPTRVDEAVVQACVVALLGCLLWVWAASCAVVVEVWRGNEAPDQGFLVAPRVVRRFVLGACGAALVGAIAAPGHASDGSLAGLPMPERAVGPAGLGSPSTQVVAPVDSIVVRPGDSLWLISARGLPGGASDATIAAAWRRLYLANRAVIGPDPDLIHPGLLLRRPPVRTN